jgi:hypothetical protein
VSALSHTAVTPVTTHDRVAVGDQLVYLQAIRQIRSNLLRYTQMSSSSIENILVVTGKDMKRRKPQIPLERKAEIDETLENKHLTAWRKCKWVKSQMRAPRSDHLQHLHQ